MRLANFASFLILLAVVANADVHDERDTCILGSGAAGMYALVDAYDKGQSVVMFEKSNVTNGYCNTFNFTAPPGAPNSIDIGVELFSDTKLLTEVGFGNWSLDFKAFAQRFVAAADILSIDLTNPAGSANFGADLSNGTTVPVPPTSPNFTTAFVTFFGLVSQYPWLDSTVYPDPLPAELMIPFSDYITLHGLQALMTIFRPILFVGGMGDFSKLTTLYAVKNLARHTLALFSVPHSGVAFLKGCAELYNGIKNYVGYDKIVTSATVIDASRHEGGCNENHNADSRVFLQVKIGDHVHSYSCGRLIVAFPPVSTDVGFLHLDSKERAVFDKLKHRYYYAFEGNVAGTLATSGAFNFYNLNPNQPDDYPILPAVTSFRRTLPYGPVAGWLSSNDYITNDRVNKLIGEQLGRLPASLGNVSVIRMVPHDRFQPYFDPADLQSSPNPYTEIAGLQGYRDTIWLGQAITFAESVMVMEHAKRTLNAL